MTSLQPPSPVGRAFARQHPNKMTPCRVKTRPTAPQHGLAMIAVLWILVALMLMVSSYSLFARVETRMAGAQVDQAKANVLALGGLEYAQKWITQNKKPSGEQYLQIQLPDGVIDLTLTNSAGLIDLNQAPIKLLADLFQIAGGVNEESLPFLLIALRPHASPSPQTTTLRDIRELRKIPVITESIYTAVQDLITVDSNYTKVNAHQAPLDVLTVLTKGDTGLARNFAQARIDQGNKADTSMLQTDFHDNLLSKRYRLDVKITLNNNQRYMRRFWLSLHPDTQRGLRTHALEALRPLSTTPSL